MSDWDKIISFSNSKQGGAIQFILVCVILVIMFGSYFRNQMGGGKQRDGKQRGGDKKMGDGPWGGHFFLDSKPLALLLPILMLGLLITGGYFAFGGKI